MAIIAFIDDCRFRTRSSVGVEREWCGYGGVVIKDSRLPQLDREFGELKDSFGFPRRLPAGRTGVTLEKYREAKYSPGKNQWMQQNLVDDKRRDFLVGAISLVEDAEASILLSAYERSSDGCSEAAAKRRALENLYERFSAVARDAEVGIVVCDFEGSRDQVQDLVRDATGIVRFGTWYQRDMDSAVYPVLLTGESHLHAGLQIADIALGALKGMLQEDGVFAPPIWEAVRPRLYKKSGSFVGWGLKLRSKESGRLYRRLRE